VCSISSATWQASAFSSCYTGIGLDEAAITQMAHRGTAWTPTMSALRSLLDSPELPPARRLSLLEALDWLVALLPLAVRYGVPVLAGTDVTGSIPGEVALLAQMGLDPPTRWRPPVPGPAVPRHPRHC
jgi:hypothetical protein